MMTKNLTRFFSNKKYYLFIETTSIYSKNYSSRPVNISADENQPLSYIHKCGKHPLLYRTVGQELSIAAERYGDRECLISAHEGIRFTFSEVNEKVNQLASGFIRLGLQKGDRIGIWSPNYAHWYLTYLAAVRAGLILVSLNPAYQSAEIEGSIKKVGMKAIVAPESFKTQNFYKIIHDLAPELSSSEPGCLKSNNLPTLSTVIIASDHKLPGCFMFNDVPTLSNEVSAKQLTDLQNIISPDDGCTILYTSGTTGDAKAVLLTHFSLINMAHFGSKTIGLHEKHQIVCISNPLFHIFGILGGICYSLIYGTTLVLPAAHFNADDSLSAIKNEKCTLLYGTPTMYVDMISKQKDNDIPVTTLERAVSGGAPCSPHLFKQMQDMFNTKSITSLYGCTEAGGAIFQSLSGESISENLDNVGCVIDHAEVKVVDNDGNTVPIGTPGELWCRSFSNMMCYFNDEKKTAETVTSSGWLKTGDNFVLEENGYGRIIGRIKDLIIRGGENIYPKEIEDFLNTHPDILESHVVGVSDPRYGEEICAFIRVRANAEINPKNLKQFCKGNIAHFKIPKYFEIIDKVPSNLSGKVLKYKLKEIIEEKLLKSKSLL